jgi:hypothetical protein
MFKPLIAWRPLIDAAIAQYIPALLPSSWSHPSD